MPPAPCMRRWCPSRGGGRGARIASRVFRALRAGPTGRAQVRMVHRLAGIGRADDRPPLLEGRYSAQTLQDVRTSMRALLCLLAFCLALPLAAQEAGAPAPDRSATGGAT